MLRFKIFYLGSLKEICGKITINYYFKLIEKSFLLLFIMILTNNIKIGYSILHLNNEESRVYKNRP